MSRLLGKLSRLERNLRPRQGNSGTVGAHYPGGTPGGHANLLPCDLRDEHGANCVMSVSPTDSGVRLMRIITLSHGRHAD
jgi:hypothetical protein